MATCKEQIVMITAAPPEIRMLRYRAADAVAVRTL
jgi:hypothetical protein